MRVALAPWDCASEARRTSVVSARVSEPASQPISPIDQRSRAEREVLLRQWTPLVKLVAKRYWMRLGRWHEFEDLVSEGQMALWDASKWYDGSLGLASFKTYAYRAIQRRFEALHLHWRTKRRRDSVKSVSMDETYPDGDPVRQFASGEPTAAEAMEGELQRTGLLSALERLSLLERLVIEQRFVAARSLSEVGRDQGLSRERIRQLEKGALGKLQIALRRDFPERAVRAAAPLSCREADPLTQSNLKQRLRRRESRRKVATDAGSG
jgi:RNA polymerase sigma factor (sigma-70 family)